jgi:hypothetical protein
MAVNGAPGRSSGYDLSMNCFAFDGQSVWYPRPIDVVSVPRTEPSPNGYRRAEPPIIFSYRRVMLPCPCFERR